MWLYAYERYSEDEEYITRLYEVISQMKLGEKKDISLKQACMSMNSRIIVF